jgi:hypothetical protein
MDTSSIYRSESGTAYITKGIARQAAVEQFRQIMTPPSLNAGKP